MKKIIIFICLFFWPLFTQAAELYIWPPSNEGQIGETVLVEVDLNSEVSINALDSTIYWDPQKLELLSISTGGSIFDLWVSDPQQHKFNSARLIAGSTQGWQGSGGKIIGLLFKPLLASSSTIIFSADTKLIKADGQATPAQLSLLPGTIIATTGDKNLPVLTSYRLPDQDKWYTGNVFDIHWTKQDNFSYSYFITHDPTQIPDDEAESLVGDVQYEGLEDGVYYFIMKVWDSAGNYIGKLTRRAQLDSTVPTFGEIKVVSSPKEYKLAGNLFFMATDNLSGLSQVMFQSNNQDDKVVTSPYTIGRPWFNHKTVFLKAIDNAGNFQTSAIVVPALIPWWVSILSAFVCLVILLLVVGKIWQKKSSASW
jgi:hypothetical protein